MSSDPLARYAVWANSNTLITESGNLLNVSTINTNHIVLDSNALDTTGSGGTASLLLNGVAIASASGLTSSIANWAQFGANSTISFATGGGTGGALIMCNVSSLTAQAGVGSVTALTVSTINGQTPNQIGQTIAYRPTSVLSTLAINANTPVGLITTLSNSVGKIVQGSVNLNFSGGMAVCNVTGNAPFAYMFVSDNSNSPYAPLSAIGGAQTVDWYPLGPNSIGSSSGPIPANTVTLPFAFSNAGANLYIVLQDQSGGTPPTYSWISNSGTNSMSTNVLAVLGAGTLQAE